ncbi:MAG: cobalamin-dependent protein [Pseudomonadota bacterium]
MSSNAARPRLDPETFSGDQAQLTTFYNALPPNAVRDLALEGFRRLAERRHKTGDIARDSSVKETIDRMCLALIAADSDASIRTGEAILADQSLEDFYLIYLAGAATRLGQWWDRDRVSFVDVTVALGRLHALVRSIEQPIRSRPNRSGAKRAIFATAPGEKHTLGVTMATDLFRRRGWHILLLVGLEHDALLSRISRADATALGVSAAGQHAAPQLARLLLDLRIVRPDCRVFISGNIVSEARDLVHSLLPDGVAQSVEDAERLLEAFTSHAAGHVAVKDRRH